MTVACPHCDQSLEFSGTRPRFCAFCGKPLDDSALITTVPGSRESPTIAHTPLPKDGPSAIEADTRTPDRVGGYVLIRALGQGGMGTVYEAEESGFGRKVALKLLAPEITASPEALQRFRQEGRLASAIAHPRCVFVLNADEQEGRPFIVMELMPGSNLHDLVHDSGPLPIDLAVVKIHDVIEGLREAHRLGVIHRDVKPSNCFLETDGRVKIGDFGLSKSLVSESNLTRTGSFLGTPLYASPEQIKGEPLDPRTDVYSVAATLFFLIAGRAPFQGTDAAATLAKIVSEPVPSLRQFRPDLPSELDRIILKGLERNRDRRWRDMGEFGDALLPFSPGRLQMGGLGLRIAAYLLDYHLAKLLIVSSVTLSNYVRSGGSAFRSISQNLFLDTIVGTSIFVLSFLIIEPAFGASPAKRLLGLRVRGVGTLGMNPRAILLRNLVFWGIAELPWIGLTVSAGMFGMLRTWGWLLVPLQVVSLAVVCSTMRTSNGYRGVHDLISGMRVVGVPRARRRRQAGARRALGRDRNVTARPVGVLKTVGPYKVRGAVRWDEGRKVLAAEDSSLGREVWIVLRPKSSPSLDAARRDLARATRPRWLTGGEQAEGRWDAYIAPSGSPLSDLAGSEGLPWRDVRPIFEDLVDELDAALRDGTLPQGLTLDQVWIQPDGRAMIVDQLGLMSADEKGQADANEARRFLFHATALALEGGRRRLHDDDPVRAPLPEHVRTILDALRTTNDPSRDLRAVREALALSQDRPVEVTRGLRGSQVGALSALFFPGVALQFVVVFAILSGYLVESGVPLLSGMMKPLTAIDAKRVGCAVNVFVAIMAILSAFMTRGGVTLPLLGLTIVRNNGKPAGRWRCAWRSAMVWILPALLLIAALVLQGNLAKADWRSWCLFAAATLTLPAYAISAIWSPSRGPHDWLSGTVVVPK